MKKERNVLVVSGQHGQVGFTEFQVQYIVGVTTGQPRGNVGSTAAIVAKKIREATGWNMKGTPMICRFAYANALVRL